MRGGADDAVFGALAANLGLKPLDRDREVRVSPDFHLVALAFGPECPCGIEVFLTHEPIHRDAHDDLVADERLPVELPAGDLAGLDDSEWRVDGRGGHRHLL